MNFQRAKISCLSVSFIILSTVVLSACQSGGSSGSSNNTSNGGQNTSNNIGGPITGHIITPVGGKLAAGYSHTCLLDDDGTVKCWGTNGAGQLGDGTTAEYSEVPLSVTGLAGATYLGAGFNHNCAILKGGSVACWGWNIEGQLGGQAQLYKSPVPVYVSGITNAVDISGGYIHTCAVLEGGSVKCWGHNHYGQLGDGSRVDSTLPVTVSGITNAIAITLSYWHTCAVIEGGSVFCWGDNDKGQLGVGRNIISGSDIALPVPGIANVVDITTGGYKTCVLLEGGSIKCWGDYVGKGEIKLIPEINNAAAFFPTVYHLCALIEDGSVKCWGANESGQLGDKSNRGSGIPVPVFGITNAVAGSGGFDHTCALLEDGSAYCWGSKSWGKLGNGEIHFNYYSHPRLPVSVSGILNTASIAAGYDHSCALLGDGRIKCWGGNRFGQLGVGSKEVHFVPAFTSGISGAIDLDIGNSHSCAVLADGSVKCWGANFYGELGDGSTTNWSDVPVGVQGITKASAIASGGLHSCALLWNGSVKCWGWNVNGQLGDGTTIYLSNIPVPVVGINDAVEIDASIYDNTCALIQGGSIACWGNGVSIVPVQVPGISNAVSVAVGGEFKCAIIFGGSIKCWGDNNYGQLGDGTEVSSNLPVFVDGITNAISISAGYRHACAVIGDGSIKCWGGNWWGQLGDGSTIYQSLVPVNVPDINRASSIDAGYSHTCAALQYGPAKCWGEDYPGNLGNGEAGYSPVPVRVIGVRL